VHWVELYAQGMKHHRAKRWKEALETFQTLRGLAGDYKDIKTLMAVAEREQLAWQKAEADRLVKQKAKAEHAARKKAEQEERAQERTQAVASLAKRVRRVPSRGRVLLLLAILGGIAAIATLSSLPSPEQLRVLKHTAGVGSVTWSPDGTRLALVSSDDTVMVWDAASGEQLLVLRGHTHGVDSVAWSPDGTRLASGGCDGFEPPYCVAGAVRVWDAASGQQLLVLEGHTAGVGSVGWSPDGTRLASSGSEDDAIRVWNAASGEQLCELRSNRSFIGTVGTGSVAWSPDGTKLVSGEFQQAPAVRVWDAARCEELRVLPIRHGGSVLSLAWSPDGTRLASSSLDGTVVIWDAASDTVLRQLDDCGCWIYSVTWSPDSTQLAASHSHTNTTFETGDRTIRVWDAPSGEQLLVLRGHTGDVNSVAWSPDGALLASGSADGTVRIWDVSDIR
jgi:WD40 repeat protein